jgi:ATP-dependent protease ClpP protease subunit
MKGRRSELLSRLTAALERVTARGPREWYRIQAAADADEAEVWIYDEIGYWGTRAADFARELSQLDVSKIHLHINSPGGSVFDGVAIHNLLRTHRATVEVTVDGIAASIASVIAMAGDTVTMGRGTEMMIHNPSGLVLGQATDMREMADLLDKLAVDLAGFYADRAGGSVDYWLGLMAAETWYSAQEAVDAGLADAVIAGSAPAKKDTGAAEDRGDWDLSAYRYAGRERAPGPAARLTETTRSIRARHQARRNAR